MLRSSAHFNPGRLEVAFVFSAPGTKEKDSDCPVSGVTGENLDRALTHLSRIAPKIFAAPTRNEYRITNAFPSPLSVALKSKRSEATRAEILEPKNVRRVLAELCGCRLVILCGNKATLLGDAIKRAGYSVVTASHTSNQALLSRHNTPSARKGSTPTERRWLRAHAWAACLSQRLPTTM